MPPALSDEENGVSSGEEVIPIREKETPVVEDELEEAKLGADAGDEEEDEYVVEKIITHKFEGNTVLYQVKWLGYEAKRDRTWEPEDNMVGASDVLKEYWEECGGKPEPSQGKKRKGRKSVVEEPDSSAPISTSKRVKKEKEWSPPPGSWENDVDYVDTVEETPDPKTGQLTRYAYLVWVNGKKSQHPLKHIYLKCPQKMLAYYETHLVFTPQGDDIVNGDGTDQLMHGGDDD